MGLPFRRARVSWGQDRLVRVSESCRATSPVALESHNLIARDRGLSSTTRREGSDTRHGGRPAVCNMNGRGEIGSMNFFPAGHPKTWQKVELKGERLKVST
jgi:hypothetical protein